MSSDYIPGFDEETVAAASDNIISSIPGAQHVSPLLTILVIGGLIIVVAVVLPVINGVGSYKIDTSNIRAKRSKKEKESDYFSSPSSSSASGAANSHAADAFAGVKKRGQKGFESNPYELSSSYSETAEDDYNSGYVYEPSGEINVGEETGYLESADLRSKLSGYIKTIPQNSYVKSVSNATAKAAEAAASVTPSVTFNSGKKSFARGPQRQTAIAPSAPSSNDKEAHIDPTKAFNQNINNDFDYDAFIEEQDKEDIRLAEEDNDQIANEKFIALQKESKEQKMLREAGQARLEELA